LKRDTQGRRLKRYAGLLLSLATILVIFKLTETSMTWRVIAGARPGLLLLAFTFHLLFWLFWALRLKVLFSILKRRISVGYALKTALASMFLAAITPSSAGGEPLRIKMLVDKGATIGGASAVVVAERLLDAIFFLLALALFLALTGFSTRFGIEVGVAFFAVLVVLLAILTGAIKKPGGVDKVVQLLYPLLSKLLREQRAEKIRAFVSKEARLFSAAAIELTTQSPYRLVFAFVLTALLWLCEFLVPSAVLLAFNQSPVVLYSITAQLIIVILSLIPLTPGSSGIAETSMVYLYSRFVTVSTVGVLVGVWRAITYFSNLIVGFIVTAKVMKASLK
jgi:uncharacterized protein (TIRG00374 family)